MFSCEQNPLLGVFSYPTPYLSLIFNLHKCRLKSEFLCSCFVSSLCNNVAIRAISNAIGELCEQQLKWNGEQLKLLGVVWATRATWFNYYTAEHTTHMDSSYTRLGRRLTNWKMIWWTKKWKLTSSEKSTVKDLTSVQVDNIWVFYRLGDISMESNTYWQPHCSHFFLNCARVMCSTQKCSRGEKMQEQRNMHWIKIIVQLDLQNNS